MCGCVGTQAPVCLRCWPAETQTVNRGDIVIAEFCGISPMIGCCVALLMFFCSIVLCCIASSCVVLFLFCCCVTLKLVSLVGPKVRAAAAGPRRLPKMMSFLDIPQRVCLRVRSHPWACCRNDLCFRQHQEFPQCKGRCWAGGTELCSPASSWLWWSCSSEWSLPGG